MLTNSANIEEISQSGFTDDGYRYVGTGLYDSSTSPNNFICFGTSDLSECKNNEAKYLYRIIGTFADANGEQHLKLISFKQLSNSVSWNQDSSVNKAWNASSLYSGLNGSYFLTNTTYDYMQDNAWLNKIENWKWTSVNTKTKESGGPNYYNGYSPKQIYLHEMNKVGKSSSIGEWVTPVAKIGLVNVSDYLLSSGDSVKNVNNNSLELSNILKEGWMHQSNNDTTLNSAEWTISRGGLFENNEYYAWSINEDGYIYYSSVNNNYGVRPVFYLTSDTSYDSGKGTYEEPFIISKTTPAIPKVVATISSSTIRINITKGDYDLEKYCVNTSAVSIDNCTWKPITSNVITTTVNEYAVYYVHVMDKGGYVGHSNSVTSIGPINKALIASGKLWQSGLTGDGYRFVGSNPNNYVCFGTFNKNTCTSNKSKYMYRIIGVFNNNVKIIKYTSLGNYSWHTPYIKTVNFVGSNLYAGLTGSYFLTNTAYEYMQNNTWLNKINNSYWMVVDTQTKEKNGPNYSNISVKDIYLHEANKTGKISNIGNWNGYSAKIHLINVYDYALAAGNLSYIATNDKSSLNSSWMGSSEKWTISKYGIYDSLSMRNNYIWYVGGTSAITYTSQTSSKAVHPVFYLGSNVNVSSGDGSINNPYMLK